MCAEGRRKLSVAFVPYWGAGNPYQDILARHLSGCGVDVDTAHSLKDLFRYGVCLSSTLDLVHLHWLPVFGWRQWRFLRCLAFVVRLVLLRIHGVRLIWTIHNLLPHESFHPRLDWLLRRAVAGLSSGLIVHGRSAKQQAIETWGLRDESRLAVIPHANYMDDYPNHVDRAAARRRLALDEAELVFLFFGAVRPYKGVLELIEAYRRLASEHTVLVVAGKPLDDDFTREIERACAGVKGLRFRPGFVPDEEVQVYMHAADAVVLPYRHLLSSGAALLAMSFGKACVAPALECLADVLDESGAFLYDPESETGLLEGMRRAIDVRDTLAQRGEYNRQKASQWTWEKAAAATRALYDRCLSEAGSARRDTVR